MLSNFEEIPDEIFVRRNKDRTQEVKSDIPLTVMPAREHKYS